MNKPTIDLLCLAGVKALGKSVHAKNPAIEVQNGGRTFRWHDEEWDACTISLRDLIFDLESKLLVTDKDWGLYWLQFPYRYQNQKVVGYTGAFKLYRQASPEACLRALHAIGKLEVV